MINPDNFIFHSDFWYPTGYYYGTKEYNNVTLPASLELSDKYQDGDFYNVYLEYPPKHGSPGIIGERFLGDSIVAHTINNKLLAYKGGQTSGQKFTGKLHWRIYPKNRVFNFITDGNLEQTAKSINGEYTTTLPVSVHDFTIPTGLTGKYFVRGVWRIGDGSWNVVGALGTTVGTTIAYYNYSDNVINMVVDTIPNNLPVGTKIYYKLQLVSLSQDETFIFNSDRYSFAIPQTHTITLTDTQTLPGKYTRVIHGDWIEIPGDKQAYDVVFAWSGEPGLTRLHVAEYDFTENGNHNLIARPSIESRGKLIRPVLTIENNSSQPRAYANQSVTYSIFIYQNNNSS